MEKNELALLEEKVNLDHFKFDIEFATAYVEMVRQEKKIKEIKEKVNAKLLEVMEQEGITKFSNDVVDITYVAPTYKEQFNKKKFEEEHADLYSEYVEITNVKSQLRAKIK